MNWLDGLVIVFLGICALIGSRRGLIRTFFPLAVIVLAIFVAGHYYASAANYSGSWMSSPNQAKIAAFIIIFILVIVATLLFFLLLRKGFDLMRKGKVEMTNSIIPLMGIMIGIALAGFFYGSVADWLSALLASTTQASIVAFVIIFILATAVTTRVLLWLASIMEKAPDNPMVKRFDGIGGAVLGLAIGGLLCGALITIVANFYYASVETTIRHSSLSSFLLNNFPFVLHILPKEFDVVRQLFS
jgi:membrane protein required for colicin V production